MIFFNSYLLKSGNGTWYFRIGVPHDLRPVLGKREIKKTLKTIDKGRAQQLALLHAAECQMLFERYRLMSKKPFPMITDFGIAKMTYPDGRTLEGVTTDPNNPQDLEDLKKFLNDTGFNNQSVVQQQPVPQPVQTLAPATPKGPATFVELFEEYIDRKKKEDWNEKATTERDHRATFAGALRIFTNPDYRQFTEKDAEDFRETLKQLPPNIAKSGKLKNLTIPQIKKLKHPKLLSDYAVKKYLDRLRAVFAFAVKKGYVATNPFDDVKKRVPGKSSRKPYSSSELATIFSTPTFTKKHYNAEYEYWLPLLALFTGARMSELCQLDLTDVKKVDGVLYLDINDNGPDKRLKTQAAHRKIPIHKELLRLGFEDYVETLRRYKARKLFYELKPYHDQKNNILDWSKEPSRWWNSLLTDLGIKTPNIAFHSFRHTLITELSRKHVPLPLRQELVGHDKRCGANDNYNDGFEIPQLTEAINKADFSAEIAAVVPF